MKKKLIDIIKLEDRVLFDAAAVADIVDAAEAQAASQQISETDAKAAEERDALKNAPPETPSSDVSAEAGLSRDPESVADVDAAVAAIVNGDLPQGFDADDAGDSEPPGPVENAIPDAPVEVRELVVINSSVKDADSIISSLGDNTDVLVLQKGTDGLDAINDYLDAHGDVKYSALHIVSHGNAGYFVLNGEVIDGEAVAGDPASWANIGSHLTEDGDILLYACNLAGNEQGELLVSEIASLTGADVAASADTTGVHGNWDLEYSIGAIDNPYLHPADFDQSLASVTLTVDGVGAGETEFVTFDDAYNYALAGTDEYTIDIQIDDAYATSLDNPSEIIIRGNGNGLRIDDATVTGTLSFQNVALSGATDLTIDNATVSVDAADVTFDMSGGTVTYAGDATVAGGTYYNLTLSGAVSVNDSSNFTVFYDTSVASTLKVSGNSFVWMSGGDLTANGTVSDTNKAVYMIGGGSEVTLNLSGQTVNGSFLVSNGTLNLNGNKVVYSGTVIGNNAAAEINIGGNDQTFNKWVALDEDGGTINMTGSNLTFNWHVTNAYGWYRSDVADGYNETDNTSYVTNSGNKGINWQKGEELTAGSYEGTINIDAAGSVLFNGQVVSTGDFNILGGTVTFSETRLVAIAAGAFEISGGTVNFNGNVYVSTPFNGDLSGSAHAGASRAGTWDRSSVFTVSGGTVNFNGDLQNWVRTYRGGYYTENNVKVAFGDLSVHEVGQNKYADLETRQHVSSNVQFLGGTTIFREGSTYKSYGVFGDANTVVGEGAEVKFYDVRAMNFNPYTPTGAGVSDGIQWADAWVSEYGVSNPFTTSPEGVYHYSGISNSETFTVLSEGTMTVTNDFTSSGFTDYGRGLLYVYGGGNVFKGNFYNASGAWMELHGENNSFTRIDNAGGNGSFLYFYNPNTVTTLNNYGNLYVTGAGAVKIGTFTNTGETTISGDNTGMTFGEINISAGNVRWSSAFGVDVTADISLGSSVVFEISGSNTFTGSIDSSGTINVTGDAGGDPVDVVFNGPLTLNRGAVINVGNGGNLTLYKVDDSVSADSVVTTMTVADSGVLTFTKLDTVQTIYSHIVINGGGTVNYTEGWTIFKDLSGDWTVISTVTSLSDLTSGGKYRIVEGGVLTLSGSMATSIFVVVNGGEIVFADNISNVGAVTVTTGGTATVSSGAYTAAFSNEGGSVTIDGDGVSFADYDNNEGETAVSGTGVAFVDFYNAGTLTVTGADVTFDALANSGTLTVSGEGAVVTAFTNAEGGTATLAGKGATVAALLNLGTLNIDGDSVKVTQLNNGIYDTELRDGTLNINGRSFSVNNLINLGTTSVGGKGSAKFKYYTDLYDTGSEVYTGTLRLGGATALGSATVFSGTVIGDGGSLSGDAEFAGTTSGNADFSGGTVTYSGTSAQTVIAGSYENLTISGDALRTVSGDVTVTDSFALADNGSVKIASGATFDLNTITETGTEGSYDNYGTVNFNAENSRVNGTFRNYSTLGIVQAIKFADLINMGEGNVAVNGDGMKFQVAGNSGTITVNGSGVTLLGNNTATGKVVVAGSNTEFKMSSDAGASVSILETGSMKLRAQAVDGGAFNAAVTNDGKLNVLAPVTSWVGGVVNNGTMTLPSKAAGTALADVVNSSSGVIDVRATGIDFAGMTQSGLVNVRRTGANLAGLVNEGTVAIKAENVDFLSMDNSQGTLRLDVDATISSAAEPGGTVVNNAQLTLDGSSFSGNYTNNKTMIGGDMTFTGNVVNKAKGTLTGGNMSFASLDNAGTVDGGDMSFVSLNNSGTVTGGTMDFAGDVVNRKNGRVIGDDMNFGGAVSNAGTIQGEALTVDGALENSGIIIGGTFTGNDSVVNSGTLLGDESAAFAGPTENSGAIMGEVVSFADSFENLDGGLVQAEDVVFSGATSGSGWVDAASAIYKKEAGTVFAGQYGELVVEAAEARLTGDATISGELLLNGALTVDGNLFIDGDTFGNGTIDGGDGTVSYSGTGDQNIFGGSYNHLALLGSGTKYILDDVTISGDAFRADGVKLFATGRVTYDGIGSQATAAGRYGELYFRGSGEKVMEGGETYRATSFSSVDSQGGMIVLHSGNGERWTLDAKSSEFFYTAVSDADSTTVQYLNGTNMLVSNNSNQWRVFNAAGGVGDSFPSQDNLNFSALAMVLGNELRDAELEARYLASAPRSVEILADQKLPPSSRLLPDPGDFLASKLEDDEIIFDDADFSNQDYSDVVNVASIFSNELNEALDNMVTE